MKALIIIGVIILLIFVWAEIEAAYVDWQLKRDKKMPDHKKAKACQGARLEGTCCGICSMCRYENSQIKI